MGTTPETSLPGTLPEKGATPSVPGIAWPGLEAGAGTSDWALTVLAKHKAADCSKPTHKSPRIGPAIEADFLSDLDYVVVLIRTHPNRTVKLSHWMPKCPLVIQKNGLLREGAEFSSSDKKYTGVSVTHRYGDGYSRGRMSGQGYLVSVITRNRAHHHCIKSTSRCSLVTAIGLLESSWRMQITRAADYAVRVTVYLASLPPDRTAPLGELAEATGVRDNFLSKVLQRLVRAGVISSRRGTGGGFRLSVAPESLTLLQVVEAIEGKIALNICLSEWQSCPMQSQCAVFPVWQRAQAVLSRELGAVTIAQLAAQSAENAKVLMDEIAARGTRQSR